MIFQVASQATDCVCSIFLCSSSVLSVDNAAPVSGFEIRRRCRSRLSGERRDQVFYWVLLARVMFICDNGSRKSIFIPADTLDSDDWHIVEVEHEVQASWKNRFAGQ